MAHLSTPPNSPFVFDPLASLVAFCITVPNASPPDTEIYTFLICNPMVPFDRRNFSDLFYVLN